MTYCELAVAHFLTRFVAPTWSLVALIWGHADESNPAQDLDPYDLGCKIDKGMYIPLWNSGPVLPSVISIPNEISESNLESEEFVYEETMNLVDDQEPEWSEDSSDDDL